MTESVTFRYITPIFNFGNFINFEHNGEYKDSKFSISLRGYGNDPSPNILPLDDLNELFKYGTENMLNELFEMTHSNKFFPPVTNVVLVVDVVQPLTEDRLVSSNTRECNKIFYSIISSLRLHSSLGVSYELTYIFRSPQIHSSSDIDELPEIIKELKKNKSVHSEIRPHTIPILFPSLGNGLSTLKEDQFIDCINTFNILVEKEWDSNSTFDNVLQLSMDCQRTSFTLESIQHAFLMLMVAFEAMFKRDTERSAEPAAKRISKLLSKSEADSENMKKHFFSGNQNNDYSKIRNNLAHGDPKTFHQDIDKEYKKLYRNVTDSIILLISLNPNMPINSYYDFIDAYIESK